MQWSLILKGSNPSASTRWSKLCPLTTTWSTLWTNSLTLSRKTMISLWLSSSARMILSDKRLIGWSISEMLIWNLWIPKLITHRDFLIIFTRFLSRVEQIGSLLKWLVCVTTSVDQCLITFTIPLPRRFTKFSNIKLNLLQKKYLKMRLMAFQLVSLPTPYDFSTGMQCLVSCFGISLRRGQQRMTKNLHRISLSSSPKFRQRLRMSKDLSRWNQHRLQKLRQKQSLKHKLSSFLQNQKASRNASHKMRKVWIVFQEKK